MRRRALAVSAVLSVMVVSACSSESEPQSRSGSTEGVGEDRRVELTQENFVEEITAAQLDAGTVRVVTTMLLGEQEISLEGEAAVSADPADGAAALTMDLAALGAPDDATMDMRKVDQVVYVNMGSATDDQFYRVDATEGADPIAQELTGMLDQVDPVLQLEVLGESVTEFSDDGDGGEVDGTPTTRYALMVDPVAMYEAQGADPEAMVDMPDALEYVLYLGHDLLPRRMEAEIPGMGSTTVEWSDWGQDVVIEVPDDDQITDEAPQAAQSAG